MGAVLLVIGYRSRFGGKDINHENVSYRVGRQTMQPFEVGRKKTLVYIVRSAGSMPA